MKIFFNRRKIEFFEFLGIVKIPVHRIGQGRVLVKNLQVQYIRPPVPDGSAPAGCPSVFHTSFLVRVVVVQEINSYGSIHGDDSI